MLSLLLLAMPPAPDTSYRHLMDCWSANYQTRAALIMAGMDIPPDQQWAEELLGKARAAAKNENIAPAIVDADIQKGMDDSQPIALDSGGYAKCKADFGYHLNK